MCPPKPSVPITFAPDQAVSNIQPDFKQYGCGCVGLKHPDHTVGTCVYSLNMVPVLFVRLSPGCKHQWDIPNEEGNAMWGTTR